MRIARKGEERILFPSPEGRGFKVRDLVQRAFLARDSRFFSAPKDCEHMQGCFIRVFRA